MLTQNRTPRLSDLYRARQADRIDQLRRGFELFTPSSHGPRGPPLPPAKMAAEEDSFLDGLHAELVASNFALLSRSEYQDALDAGAHQPACILAKK